MFTLADLAIALDRAIDPSEESYYQYLIDSVTAYIEAETGVAFTLHTDETIRYRADGGGVVELIGPVVSVSMVSPVYSSGYYSYDCGGYCYDGIGELYGLTPYGTVDVTSTYGYAPDDIPEDIKNAAISAVVSAINSGAGNGDLTEKTVGDITYRYRFSDLDFDSFGLRTLDAYRGIARTWRL